MNFKEKLDQLKNIYLTDKNNLDLNNLKKKYTSKNNLLDEITDAFKLLNNEEKRLFGKDLQSFKQEVHLDLNPIVVHKIAEKKLDVTAYKPYQVKGHLHPYTHITRLLEDIFISMGYEIGQGTEVETEYINFEALNIPADHPARDMQDTFWLNIPNYLMRTHTSTVQIHSLAKKELPLAIFYAGRAYRCEATDASHDVVFMQAEGMVVSENITLGDLVGTLKDLFKRLLGSDKIRLRPSYFPFVEPGLEIDAVCPFCTTGCSTCKFSCWIEIGGAGLIHPNVLDKAGIDQDKYNGFAFGMGLTRLAMILYGISDIRLFHSDRIDFLNQFK